MVDGEQGKSGPSTGGRLIWQSPKCYKHLKQCPLFPLCYLAQIHQHMDKCARCIHNYHRETRATALVSVALPVVPLTVILHHFQHLHLLWAKTQARVVNGDMWICGRSPSGTYRTIWNLNHDWRISAAPWEVQTKGFHWALGQSYPCYFHCSILTVELLSTLYLLLFFFFCAMICMIWT